MKSFSSSRLNGLQTLLLPGLALWLGAAAAVQAATGGPGENPADLTAQKIQTCQMQCGTVLASCERERTRGAFCPRDYQSCKEACLSPTPDPLSGSRRTEARQRCEQRCELSAGLCEKDRPDSSAYCKEGGARCKARC